MGDDIVKRLRSRIPAYYCGPTMREAADEIERLWAEIERLWAVGDALADAAIRQQWSRLDVAVAAWQEARRG